MHLKRLEINGFKSFADKTKLEFVNGIVAIVGPNGCGKSNITDAIRWVLGEQSAKNLRGTKMEDVIFSGSDTRKPVNYAEVSIILDNQDKSLKIEYSEVMITRRLYRSGESEYFINKQACRLKDISELFMDTGVGKEAYSIIGQGKIDEILSSKAEDRRGIFEEAAGIVRYKSRKKEAKKKLEDTEHNLIRIYDLISELEIQVEPLKEQSKKARLYKEHINEMKDINIKIYVHDIENIYKIWQQAETLKKELAEQQLIFSSEVNLIDASIEENRWVINQIDKELEELHKKLVDVSERVEQAEGKKDVLNERKINQESNKDNLNDTLNKLLIKKDHNAKELDNERGALSRIDLEIENLFSKLKKEEDSLNELLINSEEQIELYKQEYFDSLNDTATIRNDISHSQNSINSLVFRAEKLKNEKEQAEKRSNFIIDNINSLKDEITNKQNEIKLLIKEQDALLIKVNSLTEDIRLLETKIAEDQNILNTTSSRQEVLIEMQSDFSGFNYGVKGVLKLRESGKIVGIHGAVGELIKTSKQYELSIETALGSSLQNIVVDSENVGREAIRYLKENKNGRATFLPLDVIKGKTFAKSDLDKIKNNFGYIGLAIEMVEIESKYTSIAEFLLGQIVLTSDLKSANEIAKILGYSKRIVTLDGDIVNPGGSMTGGNIEKKKNNILGRQREIDELSIKIKNLKKKILDKQIKYNEIKASQQSFNEQLVKSKEEQEQKKTRLQETLTNYNQIEFEKKDILEKIFYLDQDYQQVFVDLESSRKDEIELKDKLEKRIINQKELQDRIERANLSRKDDQSLKDEVNKLITNHKVSLARLNQEKNNKDNIINRLEKEYTELVTMIEQNQNSLHQLEIEAVTQENSKEEINSSIELLKKERDLTKNIIEKQRKIRMKNSLDIDEKLAGSKELRTKLKNSEEQLHLNEIKLGRLDTQLENLLRQLAEEYEMSYEWAKDNVEKIENISKARAELQKLKTILQSLGEVNLGSIEEYDRVSERYDFLNVQKEDLTNAKETLYKVIEEVDGEMSKLFIESFEAIRVQFQIVFAKLFNGGRADLILSDPDNILDTGIEVVAQPPGKKLQNLALLSGGEKALTAITLLFAILRVKPVPFSVLDEVDAALDDPNVIRFSEYLREFCKDTQFVVVTHRKGTMEGVDILYGVTMQEAGVSKLVSVKFEDKEKIEAI